MAARKIAVRTEKAFALFVVGTAFVFGLFVLLEVGGLWPATPVVRSLGWILCRTVNADPLTASPEALTRAQDDRMAVVTARHLVGCWGRSRKTPGAPLWNVSVPPLQETQQPAVIVIFVHGYNTTADKAVQYGRNLRTLIRGVSGSDDSIAFATFLWRGDLSRLNFRSAQYAAETTASAFVDFVGALRRQFSASRIVVVAHSLGNYLVLESLKAFTESMPGQLFVDRLVLLQAAVPAYSLYRWKVTSGAYPDLDTPKEQRDCTGRYAAELGAVGKIVFTYSARDGALTTPYDVLPGGLFGASMMSDALPIECDLPMLSGARVDVVPLGSPFDTSARIEFVPMPRAPAPGSDIGSRIQHVVPRRLPNDLWFVYDRWRIDTAIESFSLPAEIGGHSAILNNESPAVSAFMNRLWNATAQDIRR